MCDEVQSWFAKVATLQYFWIRATEDGTGIRFQLGRRPHDKVGDILFWRKWDGGRVGFICITVRHAQMKYIKKFAHVLQYNIILLFSFSILLIALRIAKVIVWSHWQCNFLITRLDDLFCRYCSVAPLYTGATRGKSPTWLDWQSLTGQIMENRNQGRSRKNGASPIRLIIRRLLWMTSREKDPFRHERAHDDFVVLWLLINQKEVIKECVYMCQMVAQFGTR